MERPEALVVRNINFLTFEEERTLRSRATELGKQSAEAGLLTINNNLEKLMDLAINEKTATVVPADFLASASMHLWKIGINIDDVFSFYKKWLQIDIASATTMAENDTINNLQSSFTNLAAKFTTKEKDPAKQKRTLIKSVDFIDKNSYDQESKVEYLMFYGKYLFEHDMEKEGRIIVSTTAKLAPETVAKLLDLKAIVEQVRED